jgi:hypothetical protein
MEEAPPKYKIGDFVKCSYDFFDFYSYLYGEEHPYFPLYGIITDLAWDETWFEMETVYKVYCMDGHYRFFLEDEIKIP